MRFARRPVRTATSLHRDTRGQILVLAALVLVLFIGVGALSVDVGFYLHERQNVQKSVDAGALAGAAFLPDDATGAAAAAMTFTLANDPGLTAADVQVSFRCLVGDRNGDGVPDASDIPAACNPGADASWTVRNGQAVSPCVPAAGDKCNVIRVSASNTMRFYLAPVFGNNDGDTGSLNGAACSGACGGPPSAPVDVALIIDRTGSMSSADMTNARNAANSLLRLYDPSLQWVALGLLGPSRTGGTTCSGANSPAPVMGASSSQYATANWTPIGLTGTGAPVNEAYVNASGVLNPNSLIVKGIACFNSSSTGTNLSTPVKKAKEYLLANGRSGVRKGIILETDGSPNYSSAGSASDYTCLAAANEAAAAKTAGIEIFTIAFGLGSGDKCPDSSGFWNNKPVGNLLAAQATSSTDNGCNDAENTDGDNYFCQPKTGDLTSIFQAVAGALAGGARLVSLPE
ncbi:MAG: VWA domain-containing protein [Chloroflexi bacterium]|nr:VWA domain-containing protein [Chloroflexota bacterium]